MFQIKISVMVAQPDEIMACTYTLELVSKCRSLSEKLLLDRNNHYYYIKLPLHYLEGVGSNAM